MREIALDTETTGLDFCVGDKIIEIGCVEIIDKVITNNIFHRYVNPMRNISIQSVEITGLTDGFLKQFGSFETIADDFLEFVKDDRLIIHNAKFDMTFLNGELTLLGKRNLSQDVIDTLTMAKEKYPGSPATLDALCRKFSISTSIREKHGAVIDAKLLAEVYSIMSVEKIQTSIFVEKKHTVSCDDHSTSHENTSPRIFQISDEEISKHTEFLKSIKDPIWERL